MKRFTFLSTTAMAVLLIGCGDDGGDGTMDAGEDAGGPTCTITAGRLDASATRAFPDGIGGEGDLQVRTDVLTAVFAALDRPAHIAASGGTLVDLFLNGRDDHMNEYSQIAGAAQSLQVFYTELEVVEQDDRHAVVESRGHVQPQPVEEGQTSAVQPDPGQDVTFVTRWELRCGEPRVHVESTLTNTGTQAYSTSSGWGIMDVMFWGTRSLIPFCPAPGQGDECNPFEIDNPAAGLVGAPYVGSTGSLVGDPGTFAFYIDDPEIPQFIGVHDDQVSAFGFPNLGLVQLPPGETLSLRRAIVVGDDADAASAVDLAMDSLAETGRLEVGTVRGRIVPPPGQTTFSEDPYDRPLVVLSEVPATGDPDDQSLWTPRTTVRVEPDGSFSARVVAGTIAIEPRLRGTRFDPEVAGEVAPGGTLELGDVPLAFPSELRVSVRDVTSGTAASVPARVVVVGEGATPDPIFGPDAGGEPALNWALTDGSGDVALPIAPGTYDVYATHGPWWTLAKAEDVVVTADGGADVSLEIQALDVIPDGFVTADFHVHSGASFDSSLPIDDRVRAFLAEGVDAIVSTEHDVIFDYGPALAAVEQQLPPAWRGRLRTFVGLESTTSIPWEQLVHTAGHHNAFPLVPQVGAHKNGAPVDEYIDVGTLYERLRSVPSPVASPVVQLNHPRGSKEGAIWLGYFDACGFDPTVAIDPSGACFGDASPMGTRAWDFDAMEVINGKDVAGFVNMKRDWYALLRQAPGGQLPSGTANSDSHRFVLNQAAYPVTVLSTGAGLDALDEVSLVDTLRSGAASGALGVFVWATARPAGTDGPGTAPGGTAPIPGDIDLEITVAAAPWVPVNEIRILAGGVVVDTFAPTVVVDAADAFGTAKVVRFQDVVTVPQRAADTFLTVEAGFAMPAAQDTDGDGQLEVDPGPSPEPLGTVVPGAHAMAFTNPIFIDVGADGTYDAPGTPLPQ